MLIRSIRSDPRYTALVTKYRYDWYHAAIELFGVEPTWQQKLLLLHAVRQASRISISSGHGTGKSSIIAILVLMFLLSYPEARVVLVANKLDQVKIGVMKNVFKYYKSLLIKMPWIGDYFTLTVEQFYENSSKEGWSLGMKSCRPGNEESLAGEHADHLLWIVDEASGLNDKAFEYIDGSLTSADNRVILLSQPTRDNGYFWETHNNPAMHAIWTRLVFNSEQSPIVQTQFIVSMYIKCNMNRDDPQYMIRVRGEFPKVVKGYLLSSDQLMKASIINLNKRLGADWGWVLTADVGNGRDSSVINISKVSGDRDSRIVINERLIEFKGNFMPHQLADEIINIYKTGKYRNLSVAIDADGVGNDTASLVEKANIPVQRIRWGHPMFSNLDKELYINERAYAHIQAANAVKSNRMRIDKHAKTREQGSRLPWRLDERGRYKIESKEVMREKLGIKSPDRFDTYCFMFLAEYIPESVVTDERTMEERKEVGDWTREES